MQKKLLLPILLVGVFFPASLAYAQGGWVALTAGGGTDIGRSPDTFGVFRSAAGASLAHFGVQTGLAYLRKDGCNCGYWTLEGLVHIRRFETDNYGPVPYVFAGLGGIFNSRDNKTKFHFGGGLDIFLSRHWGLRVEVRDMPYEELHHFELSGGIVYRF